MAAVLNRTTKQYLVSADPAEHPVEDWIYNPDLTAVTGFASKYWVITDDAVTLMDQATRNAVDAAEIEARRDALAAELDALESAARTTLLIIIDEFNRRQDQFNDLIVAMNNQIQNATSLADLKTRWATFTGAAQSQALPTRTFDDFKSAYRAKLGS